MMFFADPAAAFANIGRAMRPGGRLVWMVWQSRERNAWSGAIRQALAAPTAVSAGTPDPFSRGDPGVAKELLSAARACCSLAGMDHHRSPNGGIAERRAEQRSSSMVSGVIFQE
ncbi:putative methyltransferase protein (plasmid) [Rhizobium etli CFN 42]|uniref:Methyltransferase protein n=1 Tax=Rhizobium etli (strain ATCC 51251 / DSM 11541 / JCM 21823 / NBRC 15573 / CFN 42) TaxID=347834 RepID=Q2K232_RHIEC|nr:putative methyltransferase protein [Rhizobium etli CFN 42]